tara:strand:- start:35721 stop:36416 length:696 start_codon:yes stop_codon:yes gene_type:complete
MFRTLGIALLATSALYAAPASAANLLTNGSFEDGFNGWTLGGSSGDGYPPVVIEYNQTSSYPTGAFGEAIPTDDAVGNPGFDAVGTHGVYFVADLANPQTLTQMVNITSGTQYTFGFDVYVPFNGQSNDFDAFFTATVGGFEFADFAASTTTTGDWLHFSSTGFGNINGPVDFVFEYNSFGVPAKDFVIDRVYFAETSAIPEPATWAMMLAGFGAIGFAMRRRQKVAVSFA